MKAKRLGEVFLKLASRVLIVEDEDFCERITPLLKEVYFGIKRMGMELTKATNNGKLPNENSIGWQEPFWDKRFGKVVNHCKSMKRVMAADNRVTIKGQLSLADRVKQLEEILKCQK